MTSKELIAILKKMPKNSTIVIWSEKNTEGNDLYKGDISYDDQFNEVIIKYE